MGLPKHSPRYAPVGTQTASPWLLLAGACCDSSLGPIESIGSVRLDRKDERVKLTTTTQISTDGVMQGPGGADEDLRDGFERGGWAMRSPDSEALAWIIEQYERADAFLFGRWTFELFAGYWGTQAAGSHRIADALNARPKYVASTSLTDPKWANSTVLNGDVAAAVRELRLEPGCELLVPGSGKLVRWLLEQELVDEINLLVVPVIVGQGTRLFPGTGPEFTLERVESRAFPNGAMLQVYRPAGHE